MSILRRHSNSKPLPSPYILSELPSNLILRTIGPTLLMPALVVVWGVIVIMQGESTSERMQLLRPTNMLVM